MAEGFGRRVRSLLKEVGWSRVRQGGKASHEIWASPNGSGQAVSGPVKIMSRHTANAILKAAGIGKGV